MWLVRQNASALTCQVASELAALSRSWIRHCWHHGTRLAAGLDEPKALFYNTAMKRLLVPMLVLATLIPFCTEGQQAGGTLTSTLSKQGLAGAKLERRYGNHLFVPVSINNHPGALMIDTGSPNTLIDRNSVNTFGLTVEKTDSTVGGLFGRTWEREGVSKVKSIAMGNCVLTNVPWQSQICPA